MLWGRTCFPETIMASQSSDLGSSPWHLLLHSFSFPMLSYSSLFHSFDTAFQELVSFRIILTTSFYNHSWTQNQGSAWLDELQTHAWDNKTGAFIYLQPWSQGKFSNQELKEMEKIFYRYSIITISTCRNHISDWWLECEFRSLWVGWR